VELFADEVAARTFDLLYRITTERAGRRIEVAGAKTGMICFDYQRRKIVEMGEELKTLLEGGDFTPE
jgi:hypothetical protein